MKAQHDAQTARIINRPHIQWIHSDGTCWVESIHPRDEIDMARVRAFIGGHAEHVSVLHNGRRQSMYVNELGLIHQLPRNSKATEIYLANVRRRFPDSARPWEEAEKEMRRRFDKIKVTYIDASAKHYGDDGPYIAGNAVLVVSP